MWKNIIFSLGDVELVFKVSSVSLQELTTVHMTVLFVIRFVLPLLTLWEEGSVGHTGH